MTGRGRPAPRPDHIDEDHGPRRAAGPGPDPGPAEDARPRPDALLEQLQARLDLAQGTHHRVRDLLEAVLSVGRELDLEQVLRRIVEAATVLVDARYGALGVIGPDGRTISRFVTVGVSEEQIAEIGPYPAGHGLLGELIHRPQPLRLRRLADSPGFHGLPPGHPPMDTFVGVPIRVRGEVYGNLYLTEKRGGAEFDAEDEVVLETLAVAAGVAVDNARLYERSTLRERWLRASGDVTTMLMSGRPRGEALTLISALAMDITGAALAVVALPVEGTDTLAVELATGRRHQAHTGLVLPVEGSLIGAAFAATEPVISPDIAGDPRVFAGPPRFQGLGPAVAVPVGTEPVRGVLLLVREAGRPAFTEEETAPLLGFAGQAALAMELAERRNDAEQIALLEDRDRIARDLHDLAIQRLFAMGMTLQSTGRAIQHTEAAERVLRAVDDLDETIKIIRTTIFGLRQRATDHPQGLRAEAVRAVARAGSVLGFTPSLRMEGLLDARVSREVAGQVPAVLAEALSNVARHASATRAEVVLRADPERLRVTVTDNGVGIRPGGRRSGLRNLTARAERCAGRMRVFPGPEGGTVLEWEAPCTAPDRR